MNNAELQAMQDKRSANIQKLQNYLNAGKDATERVVKKLITDIKKAEATLIENDVVLESTVDEDGKIIVLNVTSNNNLATDNTNAPTEIIESTLQENNTTNETTNKTDAPMETKKSNSKKPKRTMQNEKKKNYEKFGVSVREDIKEKVETLGKNSDGLKPNTVVVNLLSELFDGKNFSVDFEAKNDTKVTSYNIPSEMLNAINKINKKTKIPKSEIFNKLLEEALKNYY